MTQTSPELQNLRKYMDPGLKKYADEALQTYENSLVKIQSECGCSSCKNGFLQKAYCLVVIFETIVTLDHCLAGVSGA